MAESRLTRQFIYYSSVLQELFRSRINEGFRPEGSVSKSFRIPSVDKLSYGLKKSSREASKQHNLVSAEGLKPILKQSFSRNPASVQRFK